MIDQYVLATNDDGDLAIRTVSATESSSVTDTTSVITATDDGKLAVRVVGGGGDQHNLGYYATLQALQEAYPTAEAGDWAIVGSTDTVWIWDTDTSAWVDSDQKGQVTSVNGQTGAVTVQETLVNQTNIKSVDGNSLLGSGNLELSTYLTYPAGWTTNSTTKAFCDAIAADTSAVVGKAYLGEVTCSDLPASMVNGEIVVEIMDGTTAANKVIVLSLKSGNVAPYAWQYMYWNNGSNISGWIETGQQKQADWNQSDNTAVDYIKNKPTIPAAQVNADWSAVSGVAEILNKPTLGTAASANTTDFATAAQGALADTAVQPGNLATVATTGAYSDLSGTPTIPAAQVNSDWNASSGVAEILNKPTLATVATSGAYSDLTGTPTIPAAPVVPATMPTLAVADWSSNTQTVNVTGVTASNIVFVSPAPASAADYAAAGIVCTAQGSGTLTFTCTTVPSNAITVNVVILG